MYSPMIVCCEEFQRTNRIETAASLRMIHNLTVIRPSDANEDERSMDSRCRIELDRRRCS